jgi:hypothetical protein
MKGLRLLLFLVVLAHLLPAQKGSLGEEKRFAYYLFQQHLYTDCQLQLDNILLHYEMSNDVQDSLHFMYADCLSRKGANREAASQYEAIRPYSPMGGYARLLAIENYCKSGDVEYAANLMEMSSIPDSKQAPLWNYYHLSVLLMNNDVKSFLRFRSGHTDDAPFFLTKNQELDAFAVKLKKANGKSMFLAGLMSAVVPGSGKIYAGKWRQGIVSFLPLAIMGLQTWEAYDKAGIKSPRFIFFGSLFTLFYIGNIYGSAISVSVRKQEIQNEIRNEMVLNLHLALEHVLGKGN